MRLVASLTVLGLALLALLASSTLPIGNGPVGRRVAAAAAGQVAPAGAPQSPPAPVGGALALADATAPMLELGDIPAACGSADPYLATTRFTPHFSGAERAREAAIVLFRAAGGGSPAGRLTLASQAQVGATMGLAFDPARNQLFAAAYHKRNTSFGPGGPGAIYRLDLVSGAVGTFTTLNAGPDRHDLRQRDDEAAARWVGLAGLGGLAVDPENDLLLAMNLMDRRVYRVGLATGQVLGSFQAGGVGEPWGYNARPFALSWHQGWLYQGVMDKAGMVFVYRSRSDGSGLAEVASARVNWPHQWSWGAWDDGYPVGRAQPMVTALAFRPGGDFLIALRDRFVDGGWPTTFQPRLYVGDIVRAARSGDRWLVGPPGIGGLFAWGGLAPIPGLDWAAVNGPLGTADTVGGVTWLDGASGRVLRQAAVNTLPTTPVQPNNVLGGLAVLCETDVALRPGILETATAQAAGTATAVRAAQQTAAALQTRAVLTAAPTLTAAAATQAPTLTAAAATRQAQQTVAARTQAPALTRIAATRQASATADMRTQVARAATLAPTRTAAARATLTARPGTETAQAPTQAVLRTVAAATGTAVAPLTATIAVQKQRTLAEGCASDNPYFVSTRFAHPQYGDDGELDADLFRGAPAIEAWNDTDPEQMDLHLMLASQLEVGTVFGLAFDDRQQHLYAAAFNKRGTLFGPGGPGAIYRLDLADGSLSLFARLPAGFDWHNLVDNFDEPAADWVGKMSLGDIEVDEAGTSLYVMNLYDRRIWRLALADGQVLGSFAHGAAGAPWAENARPFGLGFHDGWLYHGVVDSRQIPALPGSLAAYVYRSRPDGSQMEQILALDLTYSRTFPWRAWPPIPPRSFDGGGGNFVDAEPMLTDLEFRPDGSLILGFRSRLGDAATGNAADGDLLPTRRGPGSTWIAVTEPEHYADRIIHDESTWGTLARFPGLVDQVVSSALDPWVAWSGGALWYDNETGQFVRRETLYVGSPRTDPLSFGKTAGLGDVEAICPANLPTATPTASPSPTSTASPTATRSPTPTTTPRPIYLPVLVSEACEDRFQRADVVLVIDVSTSMQRPTRTGRQKLAAVQEAARVFTARMDFIPTANGRLDQVAVVGFNDVAWLQQPLTANRSAVETAVAALPQRMQEGTRLDLAVATGQRALASPERRADNTPVMVLLTDGLPNRVPPAEDGRMETTILRLADTAKAAGIRLYTIGVGQSGDFNAELLARVASRPDLFYHTADAEELARIYSEIAFTIACPPGRHDWGKPWP